MQGIHRGPVNSPQKWPVTRKMFPFNDVIMGCESNKVHHTVHPIRHACDCVVFSVFDYTVVPSSMIDSYDGLTILGHDCRHTNEVTLKGMVKSKSTVSKPQGRPERVHISRDLLFSNVESSPEHVLFINDQSPIEPKPLKRICLIIFLNAASIQICLFLNRTLLRGFGW